MNIYLYIVLVLCVVNESQGCSMPKKDQLKTYRTRRNLEKSGEPAGKTVKKRTKKKPIFVIQRHDATREHYDVRLEIDGVLKSWAVPKGPSLDPKIKRLAAPTDDHPMEYAQFEGVIPEGNYGAGTVMVWDYGTFDNIKREKGKLIPLNKSYENGQVEFFLHGKKLQGGFALIKTHFSDKDYWLLIKMRDEFASATKNPVKNQTKSAKTGRTMKQITKESVNDEN